MNILNTETNILKCNAPQKIVYLVNLIQKTLKKDAESQNIFSSKQAFEICDDGSYEFEVQGITKDCKDEFKLMATHTQLVKVQSKRTSKNNYYIKINIK